MTINHESYFIQSAFAWYPTSLRLYGSIYFFYYLNSNLDMKIQCISQNFD